MRGKRRTALRCAFAATVVAAAFACGLDTSAAVNLPSTPSVPSVPSVPRFTAQRFVTPPDAIVSHSKPMAANLSINRFWQCWSSGVTDARAMSCSERRRVPDMDSSHFQ